MSKDIRLLGEDWRKCPIYWQRPDSTAVPEIVPPPLPPPMPENPNWLRRTVLRIAKRFRPEVQHG